MKLRSIRLKNFRQFYGETPRLDFTAASTERNVVVIHGSNGSGKTALLNAFTWALYTEFTRGFQYPDDLINKRALREAKPKDTVEAWVEVAFEHGDWQYVLRRTATKRRNDDQWEAEHDPIASLQACGTDGQWKAEARVSDAIGRILPKDLHGYFFFDGERIERIVDAGRDEQRALGAATKTLLGIEVLVRGGKPPGW